MANFTHAIMVHTTAGLVWRGLKQVPTRDLEEAKEFATKRALEELDIEEVTDVEFRGVNKTLGKYEFVIKAKSVNSTVSQKMF